MSSRLRSLLRPGPPTSSVVWAPTRAYFRAMVGGVGLTAAALVTHRLDLLVLATPLLVVVVWSELTRPAGTPKVSTRLHATRLREGQRTALDVEACELGGARLLTAALQPDPWMQPDPAAGSVSLDVAGEAVATELVLRSLRWGQRPVGALRVAAFSELGSYRFGMVDVAGRRQLILPVPHVFDASAPTPHPAGLVGLNRSRRPGEGSEFASIRPFHVGDRLRRIHWPTSLREGELHVTSTWADQDSLVVLVVDATSDLGSSDGVEGRASSLDVTVRAAGAVAEHYLQRGDRVGLRVLGQARRSRMRAGSGRAHLVRLLDTLATVTARTSGVESERVHYGLESGALVVMFSSMVSRAVLNHAHALVRRGLTVVVIDTLPAGFAAENPDPAVRLARRIRLLERRGDIDRLNAAGVAVATWRGAGSLDHTLREIARRASAPRMVVR